MKRLLLLLLLTRALYAGAQTPFFTIDSLDINNIAASVLVHGDMWWDGGKTNSARCSFPKGTATNVGFASSLWLSGFDGGGNLHVAAQTYRQDGNDYWPGPLDSHDTLTYATSTNWAKIWKVNRVDIESFKALGTHTKDNTPDAILTWPAKGNTYAAGNAGAALTITENMAPFIDVNSNGVYEPLMGDYPAIKGDQALWWVFSDNGPGKMKTTQRHLGVEIHAMSYGFKRGGTADNIVYYEYSLTNKSTTSYNNVRAGILADIDLGYVFDDFIGFDSSHRMGIQYNGTNDDGGSAGHPVNSYGSTPPIVGVTFLSMPGDGPSGLVPAGSFTYYNNDYSDIGNPGSDTAFSNYMRSRIRSGAHITNDFTGPGSPSKGYGSGPECNYVFTGDPADNTQWSECSSNNNPGDRRFVISTNDFTLAAGGTAKFIMAMVVADKQGGCPAAGFTNIKAAADTAWNLYHNPPVPNAVPNLAVIPLTMHPNPAHNKLYISGLATGTALGDITIYNTLGQKINTDISITANKAEVETKQLPAGMYFIHINGATTQQASRFIKE